MIEEESLREAIGDPLYNSKHIPFCITDNGLRFLYVNDSFCTISEYSREELLGKSIAILIGKVTLTKAFAEFFQWNRTGRIRESTWYAKTKNGNSILSKIETSRIKVNNKNYTLTITLDHTQADALEKKILKNEDLNRLNEKLSKRGNFEFNVKTNEIHWSEGIFGIYELNPKHGVPKTEELATYYSQNDLDVIAHELSECRSSSSIRAYDITLRLKDGRTKILNTVCKRWKKTDWIHGTLSDVTDERARNKELKSSERRYRHLAQSIPHIMFTTDPDGELVFMNKKGLNYFGKSTSDFKNWFWPDYFKEEETEHILTLWNKQKFINEPYQNTHRFKHHSGTFRWFQVSLFPAKHEESGRLSWTTICTDINDRIKAETDLKSANDRLRSLIDASPIPIYSLDQDGNVNDLWNPAAERILGWNKEEVVGKRTPLASGKHMESFKENLNAIKQSGQLKTTTTRTKKDGTDILIEVNSGCVYDKAGEIDEIFIMLLDITQQEQQRLHLEESIQEKNTLLQEIHHRVKNNLAIVASLLQLQVYQSENEDEKIKLLEAQNRVMSIAMVHELLYETEEFNNVDLAKYYDILLTSIESNMVTGSKKVTHHLEVDIQSLTINQAIPLGLLINELATNSLKYAFPIEDERNQISLSIQRKDNELIEVIYADNGVGFDMGSRQFKTGLGFKIMDSLLAQLEATYELESEEGFSIQFTFPG